MEHPLLRYRKSHIPPLGQGELADLVGTTKATISRIETGERRPSPELASRIHEKTGVPLADLRPDLIGFLSPAPSTEAA